VADCSLSTAVQRGGTITVASGEELLHDIAMNMEPEDGRLRRRTRDLARD
jgi:hypothetical protein